MVDIILAKGALVQFTGNRLYCREAVGRIDEGLMLQSVKPGSRGALLMLLRTLQLTPGSLYDWQTECPEEILVLRLVVHLK